MTRRSIQETRRFHLFLYKSDLEYLERRFGAGAPSTHRLGVGTACREIIHDRVKKLRAKESERLSSLIRQPIIQIDDDDEFDSDDSDEEELIDG